MHALRHHYASMPMRGGVDVKRVGAYLRHQSAAFTLNGYSHLMPDDEEPVTPQPRRRVRSAFISGVTPSEISTRTGIARTTVDRILDSGADRLYTAPGQA